MLKKDPFLKAREILSKNPTKTRFKKLLKLAKQNCENIVLHDYISTHVQSWPEEYREASLGLCIGQPLSKSIEHIIFQGQEFTQLKNRSPKLRQIYPEGRLMFG